MKMAFVGNNAAELGPQTNKIKNIQTSPDALPSTLITLLF